MVDNDTAVSRKKAGTLKTLSFLLVVLLIVAAGAWLWHVNRSPGNTGNNASHTSQPTTTHSPDPVKESTGPNADTMPSSNGTGPGSSNSLLGQ